MVTFLIVSALYNSPQLLALSQTIFMQVVCFIGGIGLSLALVFSKTLRYQVPYNYGALGLMTFFTSLSLGNFVTQFEAEIVMMAVLSTFIVVGGLVAYALNTKEDFTNFKYYGVVLVLELLNAFVFWMFFARETWVLMGAMFSSLTLSLYLVGDI